MAFNQAIDHIHRMVVGDRFTVPGEWYGKTGRILMEVRAVFPEPAVLVEKQKPVAKVHGPAKRKKW